MTAAGCAAARIISGLLANARIVAKRAGCRTENGAGSDVFVKCLGGNGTGTGTDQRALRIGGHRGAAIALLAGRKGGDGENCANEAERGLDLHVTLPSGLKRPFPGAIVVIVNLSQCTCREN
ncbi:MAG TPA: hypothetical protein PKC09_04945 [Paracoccus sp. (in: a-proteobacteria)]|uniref:hypothetical protein n=1 Tax=uncultured Paracoccus sp. TaxID=189685 RepID=UPI00260D0380|nr:hypothetical protein [uncultured Paracoccus sp.]HMQ40600.1 hypothetical protein [Paracoccus sp. (in: a-proteobacteria)]HMR36519.1 hypothetical protein [Paracoccus sp. (in: a-proteobacteria)]